MTQDDRDESQPPPGPPAAPGDAPAPMRPLNYVRPGAERRDEQRRPGGGGFLIGVMLTVVALAATGAML